MEQHNWHQPIRYLTLAIFSIAFIWLIITLTPLISSLVIAALIAYVLHPFVNIVTRNTRFSRTTAVNIIYFLFLLLLIAIPATLTPILINQIRGISLDFQYIIEQTRTFMDRPILLGNIYIPFSFDRVFADLEQLITQTIGDVAGNLGNVLAGISTNLLWILVILFSIYYLLKDNHLFIAWIISIFSPRYQYHARQLLAETDAIWGAFLRGQISLMIIIGLLSWLGGVVVGLPGAFVIGAIAGVLDVIPSLGPTIAAVIAVVIALFEGSTFLPVSNGIFALIILTIFIVIQQVENIWIRPHIMSWRLKLHPALIFIGVFSSLALFGILVTLIVIPLMATVGVLGRYIRFMVRGIDPYPIQPEQGFAPPTGDLTPETEDREENIIAEKIS